MLTRREGFRVRGRAGARIWGRARGENFLNEQSQFLETSLSFIHLQWAKKQTQRAT